MEDVVGQGGDREPSRWPGRLIVIAVLIGLVLVLVRHQPHGRPVSAGHQGTAITPSGPPPASATGAPVLPAGPDGVTGPVLPWASDLRLLVTGERPAWFWPATGQVRPIGSLPRDRWGFTFTRVDGGWAVQADAASSVGCAGCAQPPLPVWYLADHAQSATRVGAADLVGSAAMTGALWLTSYPLGADLGTTQGMAREVSVTGAPLGPELRIPAGYVIDRQTNQGLLLAPIFQSVPAPYELWDPASGQVRRTFGSVLAASAAKIAWTPRCAPLCALHVLDLASGQDRVVGLPMGSEAASGAFSPDGSFLALQVSVGSGGGDGGALAMQLEVAATASGHLTVVPGSWASSDALVGFGWPAGSDSLVAELSFTTKVQITSWRPGAARLAVAVVKSTQHPTALIVG
jgi:hypothetical protein